MYTVQGLVFGVQYKVNIYAVVDVKDSPEGVESKELHEKIVQVKPLLRFLISIHTGLKPETLGQIFHYTCKQYCTCISL